MGEIKFFLNNLSKVDRWPSGCCFVMSGELRFLCLLTVSFVPLKQIRVNAGGRWGAVVILCLHLADCVQQHQRVLRDHGSP